MFIKHEPEIKPGNKTVTKNDHMNGYGRLTAGSTVTVTSWDPLFGYNIRDEEGHPFTQCGHEL